MACTVTKPTCKQLGLGISVGILSQLLCFGSLVRCCELHSLLCFFVEVWVLLHHHQCHQLLWLFFQGCSVQPLQGSSENRQQAPSCSRRRCTILLLSCALQTWHLDCILPCNLSSMSLCFSSTAARAAFGEMLASSAITVLIVATTTRDSCDLRPRLPEGW